MNATTHTTNWDRHAILAAIKRSFGSQRALADRTNCTAAEISLALGSPYPKAEKAIAGALGVPVQALWPDRYWPNGRQRLPNSRPQRSGASQNAPVSMDKEGLA